MGKEKINQFFFMIFYIYHKSDIKIFLKWSLHKYKCLCGVGGKGWGSNLQEEASHTYTLRLGQSRISILYIKYKIKKKKKIALRAPI